MTQQHFLPMSNVIQDYPWGSETSIATLFGIENPEHKPQAELWMGAHPNGCSQVFIDHHLVRLDQWVAGDPESILSPSVQQQFGELPYLFKVLAAENALSIQVHPSKEQAERGYLLEQQHGLALNADCRNYKDPNHKPELVYALTRYQAMNGFRPHEEILKHFTTLDILELSELVTEYNSEPNPAGLKQFFVGLLKLDGEIKCRAIDALLSFASSQQGDETFELITWLAERYPGDIGLFAPLILHVLTLEPGQAMYLDACTPHAYCKGTGLEIMANSDNVLRAGLTPKHIDVAELAACTVFEPKRREALLSTPHCENGAEHFLVPVKDFKFSVYTNQRQRELTVETPEILFALDEPVHLTHENGEVAVLECGHSMFIPAFAKHYSVSCQGKFARAYC